VDGVIYHRLGLKDATRSSVKPTIESAVKIIEDALKSNKGRGRILVHCSAGVSRSPTIVVAYLMKHRNMSLRTALGHVVRTRPQVSPNPGFIEQLKDMEMELYTVSTLDDVDELLRREVDRIALFNQVDKPCESSSTGLLGESQPPETG
jgi:atypical dual specificity phosphatase